MPEIAASTLPALASASLMRPAARDVCAGTEPAIASAAPRLLAQARAVPDGVQMELMSDSDASDSE